MSSSNKKIGLLITSLNGAGAERTILSLAEGLIACGASVDLYIIREHQDYDVPSGVRLICLGAKSHRQARRALRQTILSQDYQYDLFVASNAKYYQGIAVSNKYCSVHITPTAWIQDPTQPWWRRWRKMLTLRRKFANKPLIALSDGIRRDLTGPLKVPTANVSLIPNPFNVKAIRAAALQPGSLPDGDYILCVASLTARKRVADAIAALAQMQNKTVKLVVVGKGPLEAELRTQAEELAVAHRVVFWGWDQNPYRLMRHAHCSLLASEAEGSPRVVIESLIVGTPVVSTDCPSGPNEVLVGDLSPFLVPVGNPVAMAAALDKALQSYPEIAEQYHQRFHMEQVAQRYLALCDGH